jgi:hypothetical protein
MEVDNRDKYLNHDVQAGLEVDSPQHTQKQVWGAESSAPTEAAYHNFIASERNERRTILGLSILVFWSLVVLLVVILAAGIGGGVGAGLAVRKSTCSG